MNGYKFAEDNPIFKDAVESFVHLWHYKHGIDLHELSDYVPAAQKGIICSEFMKCYTDSDNANVFGTAHEYFSETDFFYLISKYFGEKLETELEYQVKKFIAEALEREREAQNA